VAIAGATFILRNYYYVPSAVFYALFIMSPLTLILDAIWSAPQFSWEKLRSSFSFNKTKLEA
jgi:Na+-transporting NADH:ubiquinone oxidoreductase subunit NqrB